MRLWIKKISVFIPAVALYLLGQYFRGPWFENFSINACQFATDSSGTFCNSPFTQSVGWPLIATGEVFAIAGAILLFANAYAFRRWLLMSLWFVPISFFIIAGHQDPQAGMFLTFGTTREHLTWLIGYLYIFFTLALVIYWRIKPPPVGK